MSLYILTHARHQIICRLKAFPEKEKPTMMYIVLQEHSFFPSNRLVFLVMDETALYF